MPIGTKLTIWTLHAGPLAEAPPIPVAELDGGIPGPTWALTAGVHGDEYEGPEAIRRAVAHLATTRFPGRVIALPVMNPLAYAAGRRLTPTDQGNLNRAFPGDPGGPPTARWAYWLWSTFLVRADRLVDLHSGGVTWDFEPLSGFYRNEDAPLAATLGLTLWRLPNTPGVLSLEFRQRRGPAIGAELSSGGARDEAATARAAVNLVRLVTGQTDPVDRPVYRHHDVLGGADGEWIALRRMGDAIAASDALGEIRDWTGATVRRISSPATGRVLATRHILSTRAADLVAVVGEIE